jgi:hypothetical protein
MSSIAYGTFDDATPTNIGYSPGTDVLAVFCTVYVTNGLWACFGTIDLNNNSSHPQLLEIRLSAGGGSSKVWDSRVVRLGCDGQSDRISVPTMLLLAFDGNDFTSRKYPIYLGVWIPKDDVSDVVREQITVGRPRIIAMRLDGYIWERQPGTHVPS